MIFIYLCRLDFLSDTIAIIALGCKSIFALFEFAQTVGFFNFVTWISLSFYMDLSKLINGFLKVVTWNCQN